MRYSGRKISEAGNAGEFLPVGRLAFLCFFISLVLCNYLTFGFGMMLPVLQEELVVGERGVGFLSSAPFFTLLLAQLPATALAIRLRPKLSMGLSFLCLAGGCLCHALASGAWQLLLGRVLLALHVCSLGGAVQMLKGEWVPQERILDINAAQEFSSNFGHVLGTLFAPATLAVFLTWRRASDFCLLAAAAVLAMWVCLYRDRAEWVAKSEESSVRSFASALRRRTVRLLVLGWPGTSAIWVAYNSFWPSWALANTALDYKSVGLALGMIPVGSVAASLLAVPLTRLLHKEKLMICGSGLVIPLFYLATLFTHQLPLLCFLFFFAGFTSFAFVPAAMSRLWKLPGISASIVTAGASTIMLSANLGSALVGLVYEFLAVRCSQQAALAICSLSPLLWFATTVFLPPPEKDI